MSTATLLSLPAHRSRDWIGPMVILCAQMEVSTPNYEPAKAIQLDRAAGLFASGFPRA
jgi:hypothetical protein